MTASNLFLKTAFFTKLTMYAALAMLLASCYYTSPVPLPGEHESIDAALLGEWAVTSDTSSDGMRVHLENTSTGNHSTKGYFIFYGKDEDGVYKEKHNIEVFMTHVGKHNLLNIGLDMDKEDGAYLFAKYELQGDTAFKFMYIKEEAFKKADGTIQRFKSSKELYNKLQSMLKNMPDTSLFEQKDALIFKRPKQ
jgi:hypothetical protein